jgi:hypothetical protein
VLKTFKYNLGETAMQNSALINSIYNNFPLTYKGLNLRGQHMVYFKRNDQPYYATLEKLSTSQLEHLAAELLISLGQIKLQGVS